MLSYLWCEPGDSVAEGIDYTMIFFLFRSDCSDSSLLVCVCKLQKRLSLLRKRFPAKTTIQKR